MGGFGFRISDVGGWRGRGSWWNCHGVVWIIGYRQFLDLLRRPVSCVRLRSPVSGVLRLKMNCVRIVDFGCGWVWGGGLDLYHLWGMHILVLYHPRSTPFLILLFPRPMRQEAFLFLCAVACQRRSRTGMGVGPAWVM